MALACTKQNLALSPDRCMHMPYVLVMKPTVQYFPLSKPLLTIRDQHAVGEQECQHLLIETRLGELGVLAIQNCVNVVRITYLQRKYHGYDSMLIYQLHVSYICTCSCTCT